jgi:hypothetical protein
LLYQSVVASLLAESRYPLFGAMRQGRDAGTAGHRGDAAASRAVQPAFDKRAANG